ncbi:MAG: hypothetical protein ACRDRR_10455 [Pseudonocardiaceae bacterium]
MSTSAATLAAAAGRPADRRCALSRLSALYYLRAPCLGSLQQREIRVRACFGAGTSAAGCAHEVPQVCPVPAAVYRVAVTGLGRSSLSPEDDPDRQTGSTGMGNVTQALPAINPTIAINGGDAVNHQLERVMADRAVCDRALAPVAATGGAA